MSLNRDLAVLFARSYFPKGKTIRICDPMTGSGVRAARYLLEVPNVAEAIVGDREDAAADLAQETAALNGVTGRMTILHIDAHALLSNYVANRFDLVDLDPFGSPATFFESALRATNDCGVVAATATDMGPLSGARPRACLRKYGVWTVRTEFEKELAVRALAGCLLLTASRLELAIRLVFSHATDHYARIYALVSKGRKAANQTLTYCGYLLYCPNCLFRDMVESPSSVRIACKTCGSAAKVGGPFWLGPLWDGGTLETMVRHAAGLASSRLSEVQKILALIEEEREASRLYYTTGAIASRYKVKPPAVVTLIHSLRDLGYQATKTHFNPTGFRTNAPVSAIAASFHVITKES